MMRTTVTLSALVVALTAATGGTGVYRVRGCRRGKHDHRTRLPLRHGPLRRPRLRRLPLHTRRRPDAGVLRRLRVGLAPGPHARAPPRRARRAWLARRLRP